MKISILTAVWNRVATLGQALDSLEEQTHSDWEHVVQDGGSTDGTLALLAARPDARRHVESRRDGGIYEALNRAFARSSGEIVGVLHSDDFFASPDILARVSDAFAKTGADAIYGDLDYVAAGDTSRVVRHWKSGAFDSDRLRRGWMPPHPALFLRRDVIERLGGYDTSFRIAADYDAILRYFSDEEVRVSYLSGVMVKMRLGGESNRSLERILRKSREDYRALRRNDIGGLSALFLKNIQKVPQFFRKS
ncbi:glycosyltransferase [Sphingopyxis italica]|uniref:Glycosyltransferase n=1 Tax=Sphingopyxis italica TaxID=1129133 RepID=A0A7X6B939_9SPHN|nr:glycosyltransferase family 2 protein [Sphingopyxis italica]NJB89914.1 glycosyltransferase [Sphingopyxis italica]